MDDDDAADDLLINKFDSVYDSKGNIMEGNLLSPSTYIFLWCIDHKKSLIIQFLFLNENFKQMVTDISALLVVFNGSLILRNNLKTMQDILKDFTQQYAGINNVCWMRWNYLYIVYKSLVINRIVIIVMMKNIINGIYKNVCNETQAKVKKIFAKMKSWYWWLMLSVVLDILQSLEDELQEIKPETKNASDFVDDILHFRETIVMLPLYVIIYHSIFGVFIVFTVFDVLIHV